MAEPSQDPANHDRVRPGMVSDVGRCLYTVRVASHVTERVQGKREAAIALHMGFFFEPDSYVTIDVAFV